MIPPAIARFWRHGLVVALIGGSLAILLLRPRIVQDPHFHNFADQRPLMGVPNFANVASNLPFLFVGLTGLRLSLRNRFAGAAVAWTIFFVGVTLVNFGSAYYHWRPDNNTLVWDRLPMTIGFMAAWVALLSESMDERLARILLAPALLAGIVSVVYWHFSNDLRLYVWVQYMPLVTLPTVMILFPYRYTHAQFLLVALGCYVSAKLCEAFDQQIFSVTHHAFGGHAVKHVLAALCCLVILEMLRRRKPLQGPGITTPDSVEVSQSTG
jgi:hypothetical protein